MVKSRVVVLHPDLGIGGAERLIVDLSLALQNLGYLVEIYTAYHDKSRCFEETRNGKLKVTTVGSWIPRTLLGRCHALMAYLKMMFIAIYLLLYSKHDLVVCDQVSACIPILRLDRRNKAKILFYCHFPDMLLTQRDSFIKSLYRIPLDLFEQISTSLAHVIVVNSKFTRKVVKQTFKLLENRELQIVYPIVSSHLNLVDYKCSLDDCGPEFKAIYEELSCGEYFVFLSLNRFEHKKEHHLAIEALSYLKNRKQMDNMHVIIAGGYDDRLEENVTYYRELRQLVDQKQLDEQVTFLLSPSEIEKMLILKLCKAVLYTPPNEHFGIVPLEAMMMGRPVVARDSGGPLETIRHEVSGYLCHDLKDFAEAMRTLAKMPEDKRMTMGTIGRLNVEENFTQHNLEASLKKIVEPMLADRPDTT